MEDNQDTASEGLGPEMTEDANEAQRLVQQKLGRVMLRMQQLERMLKAVIAHSDITDTPAVSAQDYLQKRTKKFETKSLGLLVDEVTQKFFQIESFPQKPEKEASADQDDFRFQMNINLDAEKFRRLKTDLKNLITLRNRIVHHLIEEFDISSAHGCRAAVKYLEESYETVDRTYGSLAPMLAGSFREIVALMNSPELATLIDNHNFSGRRH